MKNEKNKLINFLKTGILLFGVSILLWNCENEQDTFNESKSETILSTESPTIETFSLNQLNKDILFNNLKNNYRILQTKDYAKGSQGSSVRLIDTLGITIDANSIKKITGNSYVSYTMLMIEPNDTSNDFSNLVIQEREGKKRIFTVRYFQQQNKAKSSSYTPKNSLATFSGGFKMRTGITTTEMWGDPEDHGGGGGGGSGGCEEYITVCNTVNVWVPHGCGCGHMPGQSCDGCNGSYPYYTLETKEECKENCKWDNYTDNTGGNNTGNNSGGGAGTSGGGGGGNNSNNDNNTNVATTPVNPDGTSVGILNNLTNKCAKEIFNELENGIYQDTPMKTEIEILAIKTDKLNFSQDILRLFANSKKTHLTIQNGVTSGSNASTNRTIITLNNNYLSKATKLSITRTMIHESIHTYLNAYFFSYPDFNNKSFRDKLRKYATDNGFTSINRFQHEFMGQYVDAIAISLYEWDKEYGSGKGNNSITKPDDLLGWNYYRSMAFGGLYYEDSSSNIQETDSFKALVPIKTDRDNIKKILENEQEGNSNAKGSKC